MAKSKRTTAQKRAKQWEKLTKYEQRLQQELGTEFMGYMQYPIDVVDYRNYEKRCRYVGDWCTNMKKIDMHKVRKYYIFLHLKSGLALANGANGGVDVKADLAFEVECPPAEVRKAIMREVQAFRLQNPDLKISTFDSVARIRT